MKVDPVYVLVWVVSKLPYPLLSRPSSHTPPPPFSSALPIHFAAPCPRLPSKPGKPSLPSVHDPGSGTGKHLRPGISPTLPAALVVFLSSSHRATAANPVVETFTHICRTASFPRRPPAARVFHRQTLQCRASAEQLAVPNFCRLRSRAFLKLTI
jgi:hypothetical protein